MFELEKTFHFEAGHLLAHHDGKCRFPHGHSYVLSVLIRADELIASGPKVNMVMDFSRISQVVEQLIESHLDHKWLNESLQSDSTTVEYIAKWIFDQLEKELPGLYSVSLYETHSSKVTYRKSLP